MNVLRGLNRLLIRLEVVLLVAGLSVMVLLAFLQVVLRNVFGTSFIWGDTLVRQMVLWVGFAGAAVAATEDRHISIDALTKFLSSRVRLGVRVVTAVFAAGVCAALAYYAWAFVLDEQQAGGDLFLGVRSWVAMLIMPVGYGLLMVHFAIQGIEDGVALIRGERASAEAGGGT